MPASHVLAIDQGTTSTRAIIYDVNGQQCGSASRELKQHYPQPGWVEHDPEEIWQSVREVVPAALADAGISAGQIAALGVSNQRETTLLWDRQTGQTVARAIVWQDRRTADFCQQRRADEAWLFARTGLVLDPYFSASKLWWLLEQDSACRRRAELGHLAAGTVDSFLLWRLTAGKVHATDRTNASRTLLLRLDRANWDDELCRYFAVPMSLLPDVRASADDFGVTAGLDFLPDGIPIRGVAGDQQAALFGQAAFAPGEAKCTYGTGAFFLQHLGNRPIQSTHRLLTTIAAGGPGPVQYALEGAVFIAGAAVRWLRDGLRLLDTASAIEPLAGQSDPEQPVLLVPSMVGLGAPHWQPRTYGVLFGLTLATTAADLARATLEGVAFQVADLLEAAGRDAGTLPGCLRVDGGMARNQWFLQRQADILGLPVQQADTSETTARGAAYLAGLGIGIWPDLETLRGLGTRGPTFSPRWSDEQRLKQRQRWNRAVQTVIDHYHVG